jgi:aminoglycoside phosphotransferase (APT) family kinase protein
MPRQVRGVSDDAVVNGDAGNLHAHMERPPMTALADTLAAALGGPVRDLRQMSAGAHRETWSFVNHEGLECVVQRMPISDGVHAELETELAILRVAAEAGVPVARVLATLPDGFVVEHVRGESLAPRIMRDDRYSTARAGLAAQAGTILGRLHRIPGEAIPGLSVQDPIDRCHEVLDRLDASSPAFELVLRRLHLTRPEPRAQTVVHGDFRLGNMLINERGIAAVLDWELVHLGDPLEDLGYLCVPAWRFGGPQPVAGVGPYRDLIDAYREAGGGEVTEAELLWWQAASTVWWGVLCLVQASRHLSGQTRSVELAAIGRRACEQEWDALVTIGELG